MTNPRQGTSPRAATVSRHSQEPANEKVHTIPREPRQSLEKLIQEGKGRGGFGESLKGVARELDRQVGGEYERREDEAAAPKT